MQFLSFCKCGHKNVLRDQTELINYEALSMKHQEFVYIFWPQLSGTPSAHFLRSIIQDVPLATEPGISLIMLPLIRILGALQTQTTDTFLSISHTTKVLLFKFRCNIFIGVRIIKEMSGLVASGTLCISTCGLSDCNIFSQNIS